MTVTDEMVEQFYDAHGLGNIEATRQGLRNWPREQEAIRAGLEAVTESFAAAERERVAAYISRAAARKREQAVGWWSADIVTADAWDEVAGWCRDDTIWGEDR